MDKTKTSGKHQIYLEKLSRMDLDNISGLSRVDPLKYLTDNNQISMAVFECLLNNDPNGAMEMIEIYLEAVNKSQMRRETHMSKSTMYSALKHRNPTIKTLAKMLYSSTH